VHKRIAGMAALWALLVWGLAGLAGEAPAPAPKPAARPAGVPAGAAIWVVAPTPKATVDRLKKLVDSFQPGTGNMLEMLAKNGNPWSFEAADETKPLIAILQLPKEGGGDPTWAIAGNLKAGSDGAAALEKRFGGKPTKVEGGLSVFLQVQDGALPDKEMFAAFKDGRLTLGDGKDLVKLLADSPAPAEGAYPAGVDLLAGADVRVLAAQFKDQIEEGLKEFEQNVAGLGDMLPGGEANAKGMALCAKAMVDKCRVGLKEVEQVGWQLRLGEAVAIAYSAKAVPGTSFAAELAKLEKLGLPPPGLLHEQGLTAVTANLPPEYAVSFAEFLGPVIRAGLSADADAEKAKTVDAEVKKFIDAMSAMAKQLDGRMAMSLGKGQGGGVLAFAGVKDPAAARAAMVAIAKLVQSGPFAELMQKQGQKQTFAEKVRQSGGLDVDRTTTDFAGDPNLPAEMQALQKKAIAMFYGEMPVTQEMAYAKDRMLMAAGKGSSAALDDLIARAAGTKPGTAAMAGTVKAAPKGAFVAGEVYLLDCTDLIMKAMSEAGGIFAMFKLELPKDADKTPIAGYLAAADGELSAELRVPVDPIKKLVEAFKKMQGDMLGNPAPVVPLPAE
jgi:hypothetical protein